MKRFLTSVFIIGIVVGGIAAELMGRPAAAADDRDAVLEADRALEQAVGIEDKAIAKAAVGKFLDPEFTWTDAAGKTTTRAQVLHDLGSGPGPKFPVGRDTATVKEYTYGQVAVVQENSGKMHILRVWVKRPAGWRA